MVIFDNYIMDIQMTVSASNDAQMARMMCCQLTPAP